MKKKKKMLDTICIIFLLKTVMDDLKVVSATFY